MTQRRDTLVNIDPSELSDKTRQILLKYLTSHPESTYLGHTKNDLYDIDGWTFRLTKPLLMRTKSLEGVEPLLVYDVLGQVLDEESAFGKIVNVPAVITLSQSSLTIKPDNNHVIKIMYSYDENKNPDNIAFKPSTASSIFAEYKKQKSSKHIRTKKLRTHQLNMNTTLSFLTTQRFAGENLSSTIDNDQLTIVERLQLTIALLRALKEQIHDLGWIHRDIKPNNIIVQLEKGLVNIIDLGSTIPNIGKKESYAGTPAYSPKEALSSLIETDDWKAVVSQKYDIYSMGRLLAELWNDNADYWDWDDNRIIIHIYKLKDKFVTSNLFNGDIFRDLPMPIRNSIQDHIDAMNSLEPGQRPELTTLIDDFELLYLQVKYPTHDHLADLHKSFKLGESSKQDLIDCKSFDSFITHFKTLLNQLKDDQASIAEFIHGLGWFILGDAKSKSEVIEKATQVIESHNNLIHRYQDIEKDVQALFVNDQKSSEGQTTNELQQFHAFLKDKIKRLQSKPFDLDLLVRSQEEMDTNINLWRLRLDNINQAIQSTIKSNKP